MNACDLLVAVLVPILLTHSYVQVQTYLYMHAGVANPANTYIIFIGANDYLNTVNMTATATVAGVVQAINQTMVNLYNGGARQ